METAANALREYLKIVLGIEVKIVEWTGTGMLPLYLSVGYKIGRAHV